MAAPPDIAPAPSGQSRKSGKKIIRPRPRMTTPWSLLLAASFAVLMAPWILLEHLVLGLGLELSAAPITLRIPMFSGFFLPESAIRLGPGAVAVPRGASPESTVGSVWHELVSSYPSGGAAWLSVFTTLFAVGLLFSVVMKRSHRGKLVRTQLVTLFIIFCLGVITKILILISPVTVLAVPVAALALAAAATMDRAASVVTALCASAIVALQTPFDAGLLIVMAGQALAGVVWLREHKQHKTRRIEIFLSGCFAGVVGALLYMVMHYLSWRTMPIHELSDPLSSPWLACTLAGPIGGLLAVPGKNLYQYLLGDITLAKLIELEDLSNPMLKQISEKSPGTWQHSLAMANMAEIAANAIGADGRFVRTGAYYHDLGKSLQPRYFIENLESGQSSPHDMLPPEVSCDAIFAHVTEGVRVGRKNGLPERIVDFMHMHHGDGLLEYFWSKCREQGNPKNLSEEDFRYPGIRPQSKETAILAIVDAVEAASRTLRSPDEKSIRSLVQRIVYGKLHLGQLDEAGLSVADLRKISNSLVETIKHAHHGRIEYPWQKEERERERQEAAAAAAAKSGDDALVDKDRQETAPQRAARAVSKPNQRNRTHSTEPRLDSLDAPRPYWRKQPRAQTAAKTTLGSAPTSPAAAPEQDAPAAPSQGQVAHPPTPSRVVRSATGANESTKINSTDSEAPTTEVAKQPVPEVIADQQDLKVTSLHKAASEPAKTDAPFGAEDEAENEVAEDAPTLEKSARRGPPSPPPGAHPIALMEDAESGQQVASRAGSEGDILEPGTVVLGPPPATHPKNR